jgi:spore coat polysaccharide biosynthesis protein SpsF (cytidylyltransferase family)/aryl-alcohol dehydrogenase-like predicted oxidoreductase
MNTISLRVIIQSRLSSSRLPAKALLPIRGVPTVVLCAKRAANTGFDVVVATSTDDSDDLLADVLAGHHIPLIRGPLKDVLGRFVLATEDMSPDSIVVRLTADNLFPDGKIIEEMFQNIIKDGRAYISTQSLSRDFPYGLSVEAFTVKALREANSIAKDDYDREHVTPWIKRKYENLKLLPSKYESLGKLGNLRCTLDTFDDYLRLNKIFAGVSDPIQTRWNHLCEKLTNLPENLEEKVPYHFQNGELESDLTLGTAQLGMLYGAANVSGQPTFAESSAIIKQAITHGVTCIDSASAYGDAERIIGETLVGGLGERVRVVTKLDPLQHLNSSWSENVIRTAVDASIFRSCRRLGTDQLQTLLLHRWHHRYAYNGAIWRRLIELKEEGIIKNIGASVYSPTEAFDALKDPVITHIQLPMNILDWRWKMSGFKTEVLSRPEVVIHARSVFLQGILIAGENFWPSVKNVDARSWFEKMDRLIDKLGLDGRADLCLSYVRGQTWIASIVIGMETAAQLSQNVRLFQKRPLTEKECEVCEEEFKGAPEALLNPSEWIRK